MVKYWPSPTGGPRDIRKETPEWAAAGPREAGKTPPRIKNSARAETAWKHPCNPCAKGDRVSPSFISEGGTLKKSEPPFSSLLLYEQRGQFCSVFRPQKIAQR